MILCHCLACGLLMLTSLMFKTCDLMTNLTDLLSYKNPGTANPLRKQQS